MENIILKVSNGERFNLVALKASHMAKDKNRIVEFDFNNVTCFVSKDTSLGMLGREYADVWQTKCKTIGPDCKE